MINNGTVSIEDIYKSMNINHKQFDKISIKAAYDYMGKKHEGVFRVSGEPYSQHCLRVALRIADWGFESPCVIAALLHGVVDDTDTDLDEIKELFGRQVANMVNAVTRVKKTLVNHEILPNTERLRQSDVKLLHNMDDKSLFIKVACRLDNLETIDALPIEAQIAKAVHTHEIIIPALKLEGAYRLVDELESNCFRIEHNAQFNIINDYVKRSTRSARRSTSNTISLFKNAFLGKKESLPDSVADIRDCIIDFTYEMRSPISLFRNISNEATNLNKQFESLLNNNIALYNLTLIIDENIKYNNHDMSPTDIFFKFYDAIFLDKGIVIEDIRRTTYEDASYLLLCDDMQNRYRLFIQTQREYMEFCLGDSMKEIAEFPWTDVDELSPRTGINRKMIKVFTRNGEARMIEEDASVLDFAFMIHTELGLSFDHALINRNKETAPAYRKLNDGDQIEIVSSPTAEPQLAWFRYIKTSKALDRMVKYFEKKLANQ